MTLKEQSAAMDAILRDLFTNGGPMRASKPKPVAPVVYNPSRLLLAERERLIKTWRE